MAKKKRRANVSVVPLADAEATTRVVDIPPGGTAVVIVDVGPMSVPYSVRYAGTTVIKALVDRAAPLNIVPGDQKLLWSFVHQVKGWKHTIGISVNGGVPELLESMSEAKKHPDVSTDFVIIRAS